MTLSNILNDFSRLFQVM